MSPRKRPKYYLKSQVVNTRGQRSRHGCASQLDPAVIFRTSITASSILHSLACSRSGSVSIVPACIAMSMVRSFSASHRAWLFSGVSDATSCACRRASCLVSRCTRRVYAGGTPRSMCARRLDLTEHRCRGRGSAATSNFSILFLCLSVGEHKCMTNSYIGRINALNRKTLLQELRLLWCIPSTRSYCTRCHANLICSSSSTLIIPLDDILIPSNSTLPLC